jgi:hypothetical protein
MFEYHHTYITYVDEFWNSKENFYFYLFVTARNGAD